MVSKKSFKGTKRVQLVIEVSGAKGVFVAGNFNDWNSSDDSFRMEELCGVFIIYLFFPKGKFEYKFVVDNEWLIDVHNEDFEINEHGTLNSVLIIE